MGKCANTGEGAHMGDSCTTDASGACPEGYVCSNTSFADEGMCQPAWMHGTYVDHANAPIPNQDPEGLHRERVVYGLATVSTDVWVAIDLYHPYPSDLRITLTNPSGTMAVVFDGGDLPAGDILIETPVLGFPGDESVNGPWILHVVDLGVVDQGTLRRWSLELISRWD
jgi:subtilisin-like proprotein convertase family protein